MERSRLSTKRSRLSVERSRLSVKRSRLLVERSRLSVERSRLLTRGSRLQVKRSGLLTTCILHRWSNSHVANLRILNVFVMSRWVRISVLLVVKHKVLANDKEGHNEVWCLSREAYVASKQVDVNVVTAREDHE
jgi:hypothetical protein